MATPTNAAVGSRDVGAAPPVACTHCGLPVPRGLVEADASAQFCCHGCRAAYDLIHACGLDAYYRLREDAAPEPSGGATEQGAFASFDSPAFEAAFVQPVGDGLRAVDLRLDRVHCAACVWLVERLPRVVPGVVEARLSLRQSVVRVTWDPAAVSLSRVAGALHSLGYPPQPATGGAGAASALRQADQRRQLVRIGVAAACAGNTMLLAAALYSGMFGGIEPAFESFFRWLSLGIGGFALAWPGAVFFRGAWAALRTRTPNLDLPIALALGVGGLAGTVNVITGRGDIYFDSLSVLVFLLLVGRYVQSRQQRWAGETVGLMLSLTPLNCRVVLGDAGGDDVQEAPIDTLAAGAVVEVRSGELFPADGVVLAGRSSVDRALLTGESDAVAVGEGDPVHAGTQNVGSALRVRVTAAGDATRAARLMALVEEGVREKPPIVRLTDRIAGWFVAVVTIAAGGTFAGWAWAVDVGTAVNHTVALLIVACPCALGLATPLTMAVAVGRAAKRDLLIKRAAVLEVLGNGGGGRVWLDKTGTLTRGRAAVLDWTGPAWLQGVVGEAERGSTHPVARALVDAYGDTELDAADRRLLAGVRELGDGGLTARYHGRALRVGSPRFVQLAGVTLPNAMLDAVQASESAGRTAVVVAMDDEAVAVASVGDALHEDAAASVAALRRAGWSPGILSGDAVGVVRHVASAVGIDDEQAHGGVSPEDKLALVRASQAGGRVVMIGDGVNDAAALAAADVGIAVRGGAEASLTAADVYAARPGVQPIADLAALSRRTMRTVRLNLGVSLTYNCLAVALAAAGLINPLVAAILMPISSAGALAVAMGCLTRPLREPAPSGSV